MIGGLGNTSQPTDENPCQIHGPPRQLAREHRTPSHVEDYVCYGARSLDPSL